MISMVFLPSKVVKFGMVFLPSVSLLFDTMKE